LEEEELEEEEEEEDWYFLDQVPTTSPLVKISVLAWLKYVLVKKFSAWHGIVLCVLSMVFSIAW
jgi:hypothetical protein